MKKILLKYDWWEAKVEVEESGAALSKMNEQVLFWADGKERIDRYDGDIMKTYLQMLSEELVVDSHEWQLEDVLTQWDNKKGWYSLRGEYGVKLVAIDVNLSEDCKILTY